MKSAIVKLLNEKEHLHERKELYIGSCRTENRDMWILDDNVLKFQSIAYNEGYFKLINEIIDNSIDEFVKTQGKFGNIISIDMLPNRTLRVSDNGRGISSDIDESTGKTQVELALCNLKAGSNWGSEKTTQIGANGIGASAVNYFSNRFDVDTWDGKMKTELRCSDECGKIKISHKRNKMKRGTTVTFQINSNHFSDIDQLTDDLLENMCRKRVIELATSFPNILFTFNGNRMFKPLWDFLPSMGKVYKFNNIQVGIFFKDDAEVMDLSYVNGINTYKGGSHIKYVKKHINELIRNNLEKKSKVKVTNVFLNSHLMFVVFVDKFNNAEFNTQNKTELINTEKEVREVLNRKEVFELISSKFYKEYQKTFKELIDKLKNNHIEKLVNDNSKTKSRKSSIPNFIDANDKNRKDTILYLVEGLSAKGHFDVVRDVDKHGLFPLRGKIINSYKNTTAKILKNEELKNIMNILDLKIGVKPDTLYFDKIGIMADADVDGDHIGIMMMLFFYQYFPSLFNEHKILKILSPIVIAKKKKTIKNFYKYEDYVSQQTKYNSENGWKISFNKGLGGLERDEYETMLNDMKYEIITLDDIEEAKNIVELCFGKDTLVRQQWLQGDEVI